MGTFIAVTDTPVYDFADFMATSHPRQDRRRRDFTAGVLRFCAHGSRCRKAAAANSALRRDFVDQLSRAFPWRRV